MANSLGGGVGGAYNSLPRRSAAFQRNTPIRRSAGGPMENHVEYFVSRSMSEFNLSAGGGENDLHMLGGGGGGGQQYQHHRQTYQGPPVPPPPSTASANLSNSTAMLFSVQQPSPLQQPLIQQQQLLQQPQQINATNKPREKMVTFEDESNNCLHGTPRKGHVAGDVFM